MGAAARLLDLHTQILGELFSQLGVWILLGTWIAVYSPSRGLAMGNVLAFSLGMLLTYYAVALSGPVLYESFRWYDFLVDGLLIHLLFFKKIDRAGG